MLPGLRLNEVVRIVLSIQGMGLKACRSLIKGPGQKPFSRPQFSAHVPIGSSK